MRQIKHRHLKQLVLLLICLLIVPAALSGCGSGQKEDPHANIQSPADLNDPGYTLGVINGTISGPAAEEKIPEAKVDYFNSAVDLITALETGKIDAAVDDNTSFLYYNMKAGDTLRLLDEYLVDYQLGYAFSKSDEGRELASQVSEYIEKIRADGTLEEVNKTWLTSEGSAEMAVDYTSLPATNGTVRIATTGTYPPFTYVEDGIAVGFDMDVLARFCKEYGYAMTVSTMNFDGLIPAVSSGKCDIAASEIGITEERKESVEFSASYYEGGTAVALFDPNAAASKGFFERLKESFNKTFIRENRYKMFISGILTTLLITLLSALFGTILGFAVYMMCRGGNKAANLITKICIWLLQMLPVVVLLMLFYYLVFAKAQVTGVFVAIVAFTLTFAAAVFSNLKSSVSAIDRGQTEAAYALGYGNLQTFFSMVLPQALVYFLPSYKSELVSLIKATAVVGYIAVQDLTRMGDIVRSRTYEAFFPLIAVAVIYIIMALILIFLVDRIEIKVDPKRRKREDILKGVKTDD